MESRITSKGEDWETEIKCAKRNNWIDSIMK